VLLLGQDQIGPELAASLQASLAARADRYRARSAAISESDNGEISWPRDYRTAIAARRAVINAQRDELVRWRDAGRLPDSSRLEATQHDARLQQTWVCAHSCQILGLLAKTGNSFTPVPGADQIR
jgi:hypothetical protein